VLFNDIIPVVEQKDFAAATTPIYDVREYNLENPAGIYTFGGFIGELMMSLYCLQ